MTAKIWNITILRLPVIKFDTTGLGQMACIKLLEILGENPQEEIKPLNYQVILRESTQ